MTGESDRQSMCRNNSYLIITHYEKDYNQVFAALNATCFLCYRRSL